MKHFDDEIINGIDPETGLTAIQERCAIMLASGTQATEIAKSLHIGRTTIYRWISNDRFSCFYNSMKQFAKECAEGSLISLQSAALKNIIDCLSSENEQLKIKASMWVLDKALSAEVGETDVRKVILNGIKEVGGVWNEAAAYKNALENYGMIE